MFHDNPLEAAPIALTLRRDAGSINEAYKLQQVVDYLLSQGHFITKVALQFPDEMLCDVVQVVSALKQKLIEDKRYRELQKSHIEALAAHDQSAGTAIAAMGQRRSVLDNPHEALGEINLFALCDNTFGSCCPDEVTAQHYNAECIIHFGDACMSAASKLPVFYVHSSFMFRDLRVSSLAPLIVVDVAQRLLGKVKKVMQTFAAGNGENPISSSSRVEVVVIGTHQNQKLVKECRRILNQRAEGMDGGDATSSWNASIAWCSFEGISEEGKDGGDMSGSSWLVNGVRFPMINSGSTVQCFLFIGAHSSSHILHLSGILQYNRHHYTSEGEEIAELLRDEGVPLLGVMAEDFTTCRTAKQISVRDDLMAEASRDSAGSSVTAIDKLVRDYVSALLENDSGEQFSALLSGSEVHRCQMGYERRIRQRDYNIEVLRQSEAIGVLVVSLSIEGYFDVTMRLARLIRLCKKRVYIIYVGHLNEFKISNFVDTVDCFVAVACPNSRSSYFPQKSDGYLKPVASPAELLIALAAESSDSPLYKIPAAFNPAFEYILPPLEHAIQQRLDGGLEKPVGKPDTGALITGDAASWDHAAATLVPLSSSAGTLSTGVTSDNALERMYQRSYVGLEPRYGETSVQSCITEGKCGIARGYRSERDANPEKEKP